MKRTFFIFVIILIGTTAFAQSCFLIGDSIKLFERCYACIGTTIYGSDREDGLSIQIFGEDNAFYSYYIECNIVKIKNKKVLVKMMPVGVYPEQISKLNKSWIDINNLGICYQIDYSNYEKNGQVLLYKRPNSKSNIVCLEIEPSDFIANVIHKYHSWIKVNVALNGKNITGWLAPENQCVEIFNRCMGN